VSGPPSKVLGLPQGLRSAVDRRLIERGFRDYKGLAEWVRQQGHEISKDSLQRYGMRMAHELATTRLAIVQARVIADALPGGAGALTEGLMELAQEKLCAALAEINQVKRGDTTQLVHAVAHLTQVVISLQRWNDEYDQRISERERASGETKSQSRVGLSPQTSRRIRDALLGITSVDPEQLDRQKAADQFETTAPAAAPVVDESENPEETTQTASAGPETKGGGDDDGGAE
jgi:phytoene dehydrogenase-like protein